MMVVLVVLSHDNGRGCLADSLVVRVRLKGKDEKLLLLWHGLVRVHLIVTDIARLLPVECGHPKTALLEGSTCIISRRLRVWPITAAWRHHHASAWSKAQLACLCNLNPEGAFPKCVVTCLRSVDLHAASSWWIDEDEIGTGSELVDHNINAVSKAKGKLRYMPRRDFAKVLDCGRRVDFSFCRSSLAYLPRMVMVCTHSDVVQIALVREGDTILGLLFFSLS